MDAFQKSQDFPLEFPVGHFTDNWAIVTARSVTVYGG